jgi:hypothetical protein
MLFFSGYTILFITSKPKRDHLMMRHLLFSVDHIQCALPMDTVRIVLQTVQLGPVPELQPNLAGTVSGLPATSKGLTSSP